MPLTNSFGSKRVTTSSNAEIAEEQRESLLSREERDLNTEAGAKNTTASDSSKPTSSTLSRFTSSLNQAMAAASAFALTNPSQKTKDALFDACRSSDLKTCMKLIGNKAGVDTDLGYRHTPLMHASETGCKHIVEFLIEAGANINAVDIDGETALLKSCGKPNHEVTNILINAGANVNLKNSRGKTPLYMASIHSNDTPIVQKLIDKGARLDLTTNDGLSALHIASQQGNKDTVAILVNAGANVDLVTTDTKETPLHLVCARNVDFELQDYTVTSQIEDMATIERKKLLETAKILIANTADIDAVDSKGETALFKACKNGHADIVKALLSAGATLEGLHKEGELSSEISPKMKSLIANHISVKGISREPGSAPKLSEVNSELLTVKLSTPPDRTPS